MPEEESELVAHARRELRLIHEEEDVIDWYCEVIQKFADAGHSGFSASVAIPTLNTLLQFGNLKPLTNNQREWNYVTSMGGSLWQSIRNPEAFSEDHGATYYLLSEVEANGGTKILHVSEEFKK